MYNSSIIYREEDGNCIRVSGLFFENKIFLEKINDTAFQYKTAPGDKCKNDQYYSATYYFINGEKGADKVNFNELKKPDEAMTGGDCTRQINIQVNFEEKTEYLLAQRFLNDYWIPTGIVFFILGIFLMFLAKNQIATKIIISLIFGQLFTFIIACGIIGLKVKYLEWALFGAGIIIGGFFGYFSLGSKKLYQTIIGFNSGFIFGILVFDVIFYHGNYILAEIVFTDCLLIFIGLAITSIYLAPDYHYYGDSIIGSYLFIRGLTVLLQKTGKYARYRELQLTLYILHKYEDRLAEYLYENCWPIYYVFDILIFVFMAVSIIFYSIKIIGNNEEEIKEEDKPEGKLMDETNSQLE